MSKEDLLLERLGDLISMFSDLSNQLQTSGLKRTTGLRDSMGDDCPYYKKSLKLFFRNDFVELKNLIDKLKEQIDNVERL